MQPFPLLPTIGTIKENLIPCREAEIVKLLRLLRTQSVTIEEMRRMGKTMLLQKMAYLCNSGNLPEEFDDINIKARYLSFQGKQNLGEVIDHIIFELNTFKEWYHFDGAEIYNFVRGIFKIPDVEVAGLKVNINLPEYQRSWKEIFFKTLEEIAVAQQKHKGLLVLIFDELPIMLWNWYVNGKGAEAMELLDILRERRQMLEKNGIRLVYCGSIGIKVVLSIFRDKLKYTGEPTNEMHPFELKPFTKEESDFLCECFLLSFKDEPEEKDISLQMIYDLSNGLPFYISKMFNMIMTEFDYKVSPANIKATYDELMNNSSHDVAFKQLLERLDIYYPKERAAPMQELLTLFSKEPSWVSEEDLHAKSSIDDVQEFKICVQTLHSDHYLERQINDDKREYKFRYKIFQQWWKINIA